MERIVIVGAGDHALLVADAVECAGVDRVRGYVDADIQKVRTRLGGYPVLGGDDRIAELCAQGGVLLPGTGNPVVRLKVLEMSERLGYGLGLVKHPSAVVARSARIGVGTVVLAGAIVSPEAEIGKVVILNTACSVDHHCVIGDAAHICPGARLAGRVTVGRGAWIGIGAVIRQGISIGAFAYVGAGAVVVKDVEPGTMVVGNPARYLKRSPWAAAK